MIDAAVYLLALVARRDIPTMLWLCTLCGLDIGDEAVREAIIAHGRVAQTTPTEPA